MIMWNRFVHAHLRFPSAKVSRGCGVFLLAVGLGFAMWAPSTVPAATHERTGVFAQAGTIPATQIACLDRRTGRFIDKTNPGNCEVAGYEGAHGRKWVRTPVEGIVWEEWGSRKSRGIKGELPRTGAEMRLYVYRRIRCGDGRTFYSEANVIDLKTGHYFYVRLPICGDPKPRP